MDANNPNYSSSVDGVLFDKNQITLIQCPGGKTGSYTIPNSVTSIESYSFAGCFRLTTVTIPSSVTSIRSVAFYGSGILTSITVDANNPNYSSSVDGVLFDKNQTTLIQCPRGKTGSYTIPNSVTSIGDAAFSNCFGLTSVAIPNSVTSIGSSVFSACTGLTSVAIPNSVTSIGSSVFSACTGLTSVAIPNSVTSIGSSAFSNCFGLTSVTIPKSVTSIGSSAFQVCNNLKSAILLGNAPTMGMEVFSSVASGFTVYYFDGASGFTLPPWNGYSTVNMGASSPFAPWLLSKGFAYNADLQTAPNGDGLPLLMAYALNLDPTRNQSRNIPRPVLSGSNLSLTYYAGSEGVTYSVETSTDLQNWDTTEVSLSGPDGSGRYTATAPMTGAKKFMRLKVWR